MNRRKTLLDQAKEFPGRKYNKYGKEHWELTKAWLNDEVSLTQIAKVLTPKGYPNNAMHMIMSCLRRMKKEGLIKIVPKPEEEER